MRTKNYLFLFTAVALLVLPSASFAAGGETCASAAMITSLPFNDTGSTAGAVHDYDEACPYSGSTSPDHVYSYTPGAATFIDITLCNGSAYDTKLYVYETACLPANLVACNDDTCPGYVSELMNVALNGGTTYYIIIDGYGGESGAYVIDVTGAAPTPTPCAWSCPPGAVAETEACSADLNGGCNMPVPAFEPLTLDQVVCGTSWADGGTRDTDWFQVVLTSDMELTWTVQANFPVAMGYVRHSGAQGTTLCSDVSTLDPFATGLACEEISVTTECFTPGTYWFFVGQQVYEGYPCTSAEINYWAELTGVICNAPTATPTPPPFGPGDHCGVPVAFTLGTCVTDTTVGYSLSHDCGTGHAGPDRVYELVVPTDMYLIFLGEADFDVDWTIASSCSATAGDILCVDFSAPDYTYDPVLSCGAITAAAFSPLEIGLNLTAGTYYVWADGYDLTGAGTYALEIYQDTPPPTPTPFAVCPAGSEYQQLPHGGAEGWNAMTSDKSMAEQYKVYENLYNFGATSINGLTWWGLDIANPWAEDQKAPVFEVKFYADNAGVPGAELYTEIVTATRVELAEAYAGFLLCEFTATLSTPAAVSAGAWVSIQGEIDPLKPNVWFLWMSSGMGDGDSLQWDGTALLPTGFDCSICIDAESGPTPTPGPVPVTGPAGIGLMLLAIGALISVSMIRRK